MRHASRSGTRDQSVGRRTVAWLLALATLLLAATSSGSAARQRVLVLFSNDSLLPANMALGAAFQATLEAEHPDRIEIFTEFLDADRFPGRPHQARVEALLRAKYAAAAIDLVVAAGPQALDFLRRRRAWLFSDVPMVVTGISEASVEQDGLPPNSAGVISQFDVVRTVELALRLQPDAQQLVVVTGASAFDRRWEANARERLARYADRLRITYLAGLPLPSLLDELARLPPRTIVLYLTMFEDGAGRQFIPRAAAAAVAAAARAPVYGVYETYLDQGVVGGYMESFTAMGVATARSTLRILAGERPASLPPASDGSRAFMVDWRQLRRWGLDQAALPPGTIVRFEELSLWGRYRPAVVAVIVVLSLQAALIAALLLQRRRRLRAEESLRESEERYRDVVETQTELICRYLPDTTLTFVNDAYCRYFERGRDELLGTRFIDLIPAPDHPAILARVAAIGRSAAGETYEHRVLRPDGSLGWQQWTDHVIRNGEGPAFEIQAVGRDVTDLKSAAREVEQRRQEVTHLTRVAILGELSGALAHELNQPLTAILSNAQAAQRLLARSATDRALLEEILADIVADDLRAGEVITRLRTLLKKDEVRFAPLALGAVVTEVLALARSELIERHVAVATRLAPALPTVMGDRVQLQQVILNLVLNACEAMVNSKPAARKLTVSTEQDGEGRVLVSIADSGDGIPAGAVERLFEPFFTTKPQGLGLGLSICRSIITAHGGRLWADNNIDQGATFIVALPALSGEAS